MIIGIYWGYVAMIEGLTQRLKGEIGVPVTVVATGGLATLFDKHTKAFDAIEPDLTIQGLSLLHDMAGLRVPDDPGEELLFCALGGSGEIGMNVNLYGCRGQWMMVDLGLTFADPSYPGSISSCPTSTSSRTSRNGSSGSSSPTVTRTISARCPTSPKSSKAPLFATRSRPG